MMCKKIALLNTCGSLLVSRKLIAVFLSDSFRMKFFPTLHTIVFTLCLNIIQHNSHDVDSGDDDDDGGSGGVQSTTILKVSFIDTPYFTPQKPSQFQFTRRT